MYVLEGGIPESSSEALPLDTPANDESATDVSNTDSGSQSEVHNEELASLRAENEKLLSEIMKYQSSEARMRDQIEQQRDELCELGEKLDALYAQMKSNP